MLTVDLYSINLKRELITTVANGKTTTEISLIFSQRNLTNISSVPPKSISLSLFTIIHNQTMQQSVKKRHTRPTRWLKTATYIWISAKINWRINRRISWTKTCLVTVLSRWSSSQASKIMLRTTTHEKTSDWKAIRNIRRMVITTAQHQGRATSKTKAILLKIMTQTSCSKASQNRRRRKSRRCTTLSTKSRRNHQKSRRRKSQKDEKRVRQ